MAQVGDPEKLPFLLRPAGLCLVVAALTLLKLFSGANAYFIEDEAYYRIWGLHPALSYYDHPPMIGWWIAAGQALFGDTLFAVRALVIGFGLLGSVALWRTASLLFDRRTAGWAVLFLNTSLLVGIGGILATPDAPSVLFWGLALWAMAELVQSRNANWWLVVGLMAGLGLVSKYSVLFLGAGLVLWLLWVPEARRWWTSWQLWAGGVIALLCFSPVIHWNLVHEGASFYKQFGRAGASTFTSKYIFEFLGALVGLMNPLIAILAVPGGVVLFRRMLRKDEAASLLMLVTLPFLLYLFYHSLHSRVQANWPAPLFPVFALMAAVFVAQVSTSRHLWTRVAIGGVVLGAVIAVVVQIHGVWPITGQFARKDPTHQMRGWPEIGETVRKLMAEEGGQYVLTSSYGMTGQLSYLLAGTAPVHQIGQRIRYVMAPQPDESAFDAPGLYISIARRDQSEALKAVYDDVRLVGTVERTVQGTFLEELRIYRVDGRVAPVLEPVQPK